MQCTQGPPRTVVYHGSQAASQAGHHSRFDQKVFKTASGHTHMSCRVLCMQVCSCSRRSTWHRHRTTVTHLDPDLMTLLCSRAGLLAGSLIISLPELFFL